MAYERLNLSNGITFNASHVKHLEDGIAAAMTAAESASGGSGPIQRIESLDESNLVNLRDLETGSYVLYGYFKPYAGAPNTLTIDTQLINVVRKSAGSHVLIFSTLNSVVNFLEILVDSTSDTGFTYSRTDISMLDLYALIAKVGSLDDLTTTEKSSLVGAINEVAAGQGSGGNVDYVSVEPAEDDIPKIFFGGALQQTKDEAVVSFRYISKTDDFSGYVEIKAQGNSSMAYPKKNQTVKMFKDEACDSKMKVDFKGWGKQNKHCYKANWIDLSHSRNVVSARLWADVVRSRANYADLPELFRTTPNQGAVDGFPVKVYAAGVYQGRYTLNIPKDKWTFNMDDNLDEHCVLCGENYASGCFRESAQINESDWTDEIHDVVPASIKTRWNQVISFVMHSTDEEFRANLSQYFYVDSLIDYYLFGLASCGLDAFGKNQIYATYDGQRWIASMYDMDSTWGLYWNGSKFVATDYARTSYEDMVSGRQGNLLYIRLEQLFSAELQTRWEELKNGALSIENIINRFERFTDITPAELVKEDYASTTGGGKFTGIPSQSTNNIQQIRAFALARQAWTDEYVAGLTPAIPVPCEGITLDKTTLTFTAEGTQTVTATVVPDGCTDNVIWVSSRPDIASISVDGNVCTVEAVANGSATISVSCGDYSASCSVAVSGIAEPVPCTGITLDKTELSFDGEGSETLTATVTPTDTTDKIVWSSDNEKVAKVADGTVTSIGSGTCNIIATCGGYSASCSVSVQNLGIDYTLDALSGVTWQTDTDITSNGATTTKANHHVTEKLTLQDCAYVMYAGTGNTWLAVFVYDEDDNFVGSVSNYEGGSYINIYASPNYKYVIRTYSESDAYKNMTLMPVDKSAIAEYIAVNLSDYTWKDGRTGAEIIIPKELGTALYKSVDQSGNPLLLPSNINGAKANTQDLFILSSYAENDYLIAPYFTTGEAAQTYFTEHNTVLEFNKRYQ